MRIAKLPLALIPVLAVMAILSSCKDSSPIKIGFVAGLTGKVADLGVGGRNGVMLAVEQRNAAGGINGRPLELVIRNDEQNPDTAKKVISELVAQNIEAVIGPMTSSMAMAMVPVVNSSQTILLSPTVTTKDLGGRDDNFLRVMSTTATYAEKSAAYQFNLGRRRVSAIYDVGNKSYTESWFNDFRSTFEKLGGKVVSVSQFKSEADIRFAHNATEILSFKPDLVLILANSVDAGTLCQQIRKHDAKVPIVLSEWASTEALIDLGGSGVEGITIAQFLNRSDSSQKFQEFRSAYLKRFGKEPGFAGMAGYDSALVLMEALRTRPASRSLKETIIGKGTFNGVQQQITIDKFGDATRNTYITVIKDGKYITLQ
ncbi:ABC transporter substrate-binding protein [Geomonas limicola]|uniref:ABC transporter substrate-binding protein n=1 Tax=Geomonas limicola TaxID=2740186 RepID=A0A6V8N3Z6_9BACT|nr:ABC transporter substrate-binding protein [Geomonas limicola]GFO67236.1 ABC transporter substrate-binding protein [Geomonas limicola]